MKGYSTFTKAPALLEPHTFSVMSRNLLGGGGSYPSAEVQSVYSTADWAIFTLEKCL